MSVLSSLFTTASTFVSPYTLYLKIAAIVVAVGAILGMGLYVRHVFNDRAALQAKNGDLSARLVIKDQQMEALQQQYKAVAAMQKEIADAVKKVRTHSQTIIQRIETEPAPVAAADGRVTLIPAGLLSATNATDGLPRLGRYTSAGARAIHAAGAGG